VATHVDTRPATPVPRPLRAALPLAALALVALATGADPDLPWRAGVVGAALFALAAVTRWSQQQRELRRVRATADRLILAGHEQHAPPAVVLWRANELAGEPHRRLLGREVEHILRAASPARLPSAAPLDRPGIRASEPLLRRLADRLADERPVSARGVLLAERLLADPAGALYDPAAPEPLPVALLRVLRALEP
jgi:hypothetical protein